MRSCKFVVWEAGETADDGGGSRAERRRDIAQRPARVRNSLLPSIDVSAGAAAEQPNGVLDTDDAAGATLCAG